MLLTIVDVLTGRWGNGRVAARILSVTHHAHGDFSQMYGQDTMLDEQRKDASRNPRLVKDVVFAAKERLGCPCDSPPTKRSLVVVSGCVAAVLAAMIASPTIVAASPAKQADQQVAVVRDITAQSDCHRIITTTPDTVKEHTTTVPCSPGTIIASTVEILSQAEANHEQYVLLPAKAASAAEMATARQGIFTLMDHVRGSASTAARGTTGQVQPYSGIGGGGGGGGFACGATNNAGASAKLPSSWGYIQGQDTYIYGSTNFYLDPSCGYVTLNTASAQKTGYANVYWQSVSYASGHWTWGSNPFITMSGISQGIHSTHNAGYWFQETYCSSSFCSPFDTILTYNLAIL